MDNGGQPCARRNDERLAWPTFPEVAITSARGLSKLLDHADPKEGTTLTRIAILPTGVRLPSYSPDQGARVPRGH